MVLNQSKSALPDEGEVSLPQTFRHDAFEFKKSRYRYRRSRFFRDAPRLKELFAGRILETRSFADKFGLEQACWEWTGPRKGDGYGLVEFEGKAWTIHRLAFWFVTGGADNSSKIVSRQFICHKCNNPPCFNPHHLYSGNHRTNALDKLGWFAMISDEELSAIRNSILPTVVLMKKYHLGRSHVCAIRPFHLLAANCTAAGVPIPRN